MALKVFLTIFTVNLELAVVVSKTMSILAGPQQVSAKFQTDSD